MFGLLNSVLDLTEKTMRIVTAPAEIALNVANAALKPIADATQELVDETREIK